MRGGAKSKGLGSLQVTVATARPAPPPPAVIGRRPAPRLPGDRRPAGQASRRGRRLYIPLLRRAGRAGTIPPPLRPYLLSLLRSVRSTHRTHGPQLELTHGPRAGMAKRGPTTGTLLPRVLLALVVALADRGTAAPNGTRHAELGHGWDGLVARSLARLPVAAQPPQAAVRSGAGDYLLGLKRLRRLYCNVGIGFHLQVLPDGRIGGVHADTRDSEFWARRGDRVPGSSSLGG